MSFATGTNGYSFVAGSVYDTAVDWVNTAFTNHPAHFSSGVASKSANTSFVFRDSREGGIERVIHAGDQLPAADAAVTAAPGFFT
jgi:hypothetical protein